VKILALSDVELPQMQNLAYLRRTYGDVDLVISCGDLPAAYLDYVTSALNIPMFFVRGNHDESYRMRMPGGDDLHMRFVRYRGLTFAGIEGSLRYNRGTIQYTEFEMMNLVLRWGLRMLPRRLFRQHGVDVMVTHAPPRHIHDREDRPHMGFRSFRKLIEWYRPRYFLHGHVDVYDRREETWTDFMGTQVVNIDPVRLLEINRL
jgi:Icc-related predicted phosphoesterase